MSRQWYQLDSTSTHFVPVQNPPRRGFSTASKLAARRNPSVLLEISFSAPEVLLDDSEDELEIDGEDFREGHGEHGTIQEEDSSDLTVSFEMFDLRVA